MNDSEAATNKMVFDHQQRIEEVKLEHEQLVAKLRLEHERNAKTAAAQLAKHVEAIEGDFFVKLFLLISIRDNTIFSAQSE